MTPVPTGPAGSRRRRGRPAPVRRGLPISARAAGGARYRPWEAPAAGPRPGLPGTAAESRPRDRRPVGRVPARCPSDMRDPDPPVADLRPGWPTWAAPRDGDGGGVVGAVAGGGGSGSPGRGEALPRPEGSPGPRAPRAGTGGRPEPAGRGHVPRLVPLENHEKARGNGGRGRRLRPRRPHGAVAGRGGLAARPRRADAGGWRRCDPPRPRPPGGPAPAAGRPARVRDGRGAGRIRRDGIPPTGVPPVRPGAVAAGGPKIFPLDGLPGAA